MSLTTVYIAFFVFFTAYHFVSFSFMSYVYSKNKFPALPIIIAGIVNVSFWFFYPIGPFAGNETLLVILFTIILFIENKLVFKVSNSYALFITLAFSINTFSKRMVLIAFSVLFRSSIESFNQGVLALDNFYLALAFSFCMSIGAITLSKTILTRTSLDTILADKQNMIFATTLLSIIFILLTVFTFFGGIISGYVEGFAYQYILIGIFTLGGFIASILYAYHLSDLRLAMDSYHKISHENAQEKELIKELEVTASTDFLTSLGTRDVADNLISQYVNDKQKFFITFIDMDNLKIANDNFGHDEGDFYIKKVAAELKSSFPDDLINRYGGDEFVVVGKFNNEEEVHARTLKCFNRIGAIKSVYDKQYDTAISYGTVFVPSSNGLSPQKLVSIADHRMYQFKKQKKHHRAKHYNGLK